MWYYFRLPVLWILWKYLHIKYMCTSNATRFLLDKQPGSWFIDSLEINTRLKPLIT